MPNGIAAELAARVPNVWRANQMAAFASTVTSSGYPRLDAELPNQGWPASALIELLLQQAGIGEMQLVRPALGAIATTRHVMLIQPPHLPHATAWLGWSLPAEHLYWIKPARTADALWTAEQILRNGSCGAVLLWQTHVRPDALRRLNLAAQGGQTTFWLLRPLATAQDASPAPLRLGVRPARAGVDISMIKRRGPLCANPFYVALAGMPGTPSAPSFTQPNSPPPFHHAPLDQRAPAAAVTRIDSSALV